MSSELVTVYFDYLCPFSWRVAELLDMVSVPLNLQCEWKHFSLYQSNSKDNSWQIWNEKIEDDSQNGSKGLLPFLASHAAKRQGETKFHAFRLALLRACHRDHLPFNKDTIWHVAEQVGLHMPTFASDLNDPECRTALAHEHMQAATLDVFGTPTLRFQEEHSEHIAYLRIREIPLHLEEAVELFQTYQKLLCRYPYLETIRRPRPRNN